MRPISSIVNAMPQDYRISGIGYITFKGFGIPRYHSLRISVANNIPLPHSNLFISIYSLQCRPDRQFPAETPDSDLVVEQFFNR